VKNIKAYVLFISAILSMSAHAGLISGNHTLSNGKTVALQGLEWMPLTYTAGMARLDIEDGFTDRFGGVWGANDWRYATRSETAILLQSLWGGTHSGWHPNNYLGATWFHTNFGGIDNDSGYGANRIDGKFNVPWYKNSDAADFIFGLDGQCASSLEVSCLGRINVFDNFLGWEESLNIISGETELVYTPNTGPAGMFDDTVGLKVGYYDYNETVEKNLSYSGLGSLLVRNHANTPTVSAPTAISLFGMGLFGVVMFRRSKSSK
jgi:hypothetical protein